MNPFERSPALAPAVSFILGVTLAGAEVPWVAVGCAVSCAAWSISLRRIHLLLPALVLAGSLHGARDLEEDRTRIAAWLDRPAGFVDLHLVGRVVASPEPTTEGERIVLVDGTPEALPELRDRPFRSRLRIRVAPPEAMAAVDRLRRGDAIRVWCRLGLPRRYGNPGSPDPFLSMRSRRLLATGIVKSPRLVERLENGRRCAGRSLDRFKSGLREALDRICRERQGARGLLGAMLLGEREMVPREDFRVLRDAGMVHITAISGLHVSMLAMVLLGAMWRSRIPRCAVPAACSAILSGLALMVGCRPPVLRAVLTASAGLTGRWLGRSGTPLNSLALVAAVLAAVCPAMVFDAGYQLSFAATAGILLFTGPLSRSLPLPATLALPVAVSLSAYLCTAPLVAFHFGRLAPVAVVSNLAAAPLCGSILAGGSAALLLEDVPLLGETAAGFAVGACELLMSVAGKASLLPCAGMRAILTTCFIFSDFYRASLLFTEYGCWIRKF